MRKIFYNPYSGNGEGSHESWPKKGQKLLAKPNDPTPKEVSASYEWIADDWPVDDFMIPEAFKDGADLLIEALKHGGDGSHPDRFLFPILYFYRHATELRLKDILRVGIQLNLKPSTDATERALNGHALSPLWDCVRELLVDLWPNSDPEPLEAIDDMIAEFTEIDNNGQRLRYAKDKNGQRFEHNMPDWIDLLNLREVYDGLWSLLDGCLTHLKEHENYKPSCST